MFSRVAWREASGRASGLGRRNRVITDRAKLSRESRQGTKAGEGRACRWGASNDDVRQDYRLVTNKPSNLDSMLELDLDVMCHYGD